MRTLFLSTAAGAMLFASAASTDATQVAGKAENIHSATKAAEKQSVNDEESKNVAYGMYPESDILDEQVDEDDYQMQVVENNQNIRVIILKDAEGNPQYKSVFVKDKNIVKVISFDQGLVFQGVIGF
ncbi:hypothetical protein GCM10007063_08620 [Lentibacillus kapialis]|uniref:PepSY domain-containing protein n=1 Tax=Lentibacillus kapialis TaxID=340214 RepID=A0A917PRM7_9BACI|nr:hypothetical protein [Lentibacillus kapialis]GGJ88412.1 hypothetical protein GCM10007063_08620 [Lentibacillus kapialis]